jgi:hypothetical protein
MELLVFHVSKMLWPEGVETAKDNVGESNPWAVPSERHPKSKVQHHNVLTVGFVPTV